MSAIPRSVFVDRLSELDHGEFCAFVADIWTASAWETTIDDAVVVARKNGREQRLLVRPPGRLGRLRSTPSADGSIDQIVIPRLDGGGLLRRSSPDAPVVDAGDLRHRLLYGLEGDVAGGLCREYLDTPLRGGDWQTSSYDLPSKDVVLASVAALLIVGAIALLVLGVPFVGDGPAQATAGESSLANGMDVEITTTPTRSRIEPADGVLSGTTVYVSSFDGRITALDGASGEPFWTAELDEPAGPPIVVGGTLYARSGDAVYAFDAATGDPEWTYDDVVLQSITPPTVVDGTVYIGDVDDGGELDERTELTALDAETGTEEWNVTVPGTVTGTPTIANGTAYIGALEGVVYAIDLDSRDIAWSSGNVGAQYHPTPVLTPPSNGTGNGTLIAGGRNGVYGIDAGNGQLRWEQTSQPVSGSVQPVVDWRGPDWTGANAGERGNGTVYLANLRTFVNAIDAGTGEIPWTFIRQGIEMGQPTVGGIADDRLNRTLYVPARDFVNGVEGRLYAINPAERNETWRFELNRTGISGVTTAGKTVYSAVGNGTLFALDAETGEPRWRRNVSGEWAATPTVVENPYAGDSVDSYVRLGVDAHHDWLYDDGTATNESFLRFAILGHDDRGRVAPKEDGRLQVTVANTGTEPGEVTVDWSLGWTPDEGETARTVELDPAEAATVTLSVAVPAETGTHEYTVSVGTETAAGNLTVVDRPPHEVSGVDDPAEVWQGEETEIIATVHNPGDVEATTPIGLEFNGELLDQTERTLGANESRSVTFSLDVEDDLPSGEYNYTVATGDHARTGTIEVLTVDERADAMPVVIRVFVLTMLLSGVGLGSWAVRNRFRGDGDSDDAR